MRTSTRLASVIALFTAGLPGVASAQLLFEDQGVDKLPPACNDGCWTNYGRIVDVNGDDKLDLVFPNSTGFFSAPGAEPLVIYLNDGAANFTDASSMLIGGFQGRIRQVAFADIDGDGDIDMFAPDADGQADKLFVNQNNTSFVDEAAARLGGLQSTAGATRFADVDNDGDMDLVVANGYVVAKPDTLNLYLNDGTGNFTEKAGAFPAFTGTGANPDDIDFADFDGDFDLDLLVNPHNGTGTQQNPLPGNPFILFNDGAGNFGNAVILPDPGNGTTFHYNPGVADLDGDGDRDIVIDNLGPSRREVLLLNAGDGTFEDRSMQITPNTTADDNGAAFIDYDGDGDFDLVVPTLATADERLYANDGAANFTRVNGAFTAADDATLWIDFGDLNGDGRLDAATAQGESGPNFNERVYLGTMDLAPDTRAPTIAAQESTVVGAGETVVRFAVTDNAVTDDGPRLKRAFVLADGVPFDARFVGGDLFRAVIPAGMATAGATITACAEDLAGNLTAGCEVANPTTSTSVSGSGTGNGSASSGGATGGGTTSGGGGAGSNDDGTPEGGCDCRVAPATGSALPWLAVSALAIAVGARRARRRA